MAHKMDGMWTYFEALPGYPPEKDEIMELVIPDSGEVDETKSKHKNKKLDGTATDKTIKLFRGQPADRRDYSGTLVFDQVLSGKKHMVIVGTWKNNPQGKSEHKIAPLDQNEGVWIITKP
jgi:hypothetical protein